MLWIPLEIFIRRGGEISASEQIILPVQGSSRMMPDTLIHEVNNMVIEDETYF